MFSFFIKTAVIEDKTSYYTWLVPRQVFNIMVLMAKHLSKIMSQMMKHGIIATLYKQKYSSTKTHSLFDQD
jgi:hypothetical protein